MEIKINKSQLRLLLAALSAVTPTGGGSPQLHLLLTLQEQCGETPDPQKVADLQATAYNEFVEARYDEDPKS